MFQLYIDYYKAQDLSLAQDSTWYKIMCKQTVAGIALNHAVDDEEFLREDNPLFLFSQNEGIIFSDESTFMNGIPQDHSSVLKHPCGAFILPIDADQAKEVQDKYGVICQSAKGDLSCKMLTIDDIDVSGPNENGATWGRFPFGPIIPTNTLIIQDRYFFRSDRGETIDDCYENFANILKHLLPMSFSGIFHLMIVVDATKIEERDDVSFEDVVGELTEIKKHFEADRGYEILFEVLSISGESHYYHITHNRRIISNYYSIAAEHKLKAFRGTLPLADQTLTSKMLYSKGLRDKLSDAPEGKHRKWLENFRHMVKNSQEVYDYARNGECRACQLFIKNRLLS